MSRNKLRSLGALITLAILTSCARNESVLWREFQARKQAAAADRRPAQQGASCFAQRFEAEQIKKEIKEMQARYPKAEEKRRLSFGKRDYDSLHPALVDFLTAHNHLQKDKGASWIASIDAQAACPDAADPEGDSACFVQKIYSPDGDYKKSMEGLVHYWFFLKTGVVMAAQATYPWYREPAIVNHSPAGASLNQYLFNADEWRAWWKMAHLLPPSMTHMPSLETVHRVPRGTHPAEWKRGQACGLSVGTWNSGLALFDDYCLRLHSTKPDDTTVSYFYPATTHEFGHRLSAWAFTRDPAHDRIELDESPEFLKLSNWRKAQLVTPDGKAQVQWESNPKAGYVSSFARINPSEDFAETVGYFRTNPNHTHQASREKYELVKRLVYNNRGYTLEELQQAYAAEAARSVIENVGAILSPCLPNGVEKAEKPVPAAKKAAANGRKSAVAATTAASPAASPSASPVAAASPSASPAAPAAVVTDALADPQYRTVEESLQLNEKIPAAGASCIRAKVLNQIAEALKDIRLNEAEGCDTLQKRELDVVQAALETLTGKLAPYLRGELEIIDLAKVTADFRAKVDEGYDARATLLLCWRKADPRACYQKSMEERMTALFAEHGATMETVHRDSAEVEKERFRRLHAYDVVVAETSEYYESLMTGQLAKIPSQAETVWVQCREAQDQTDLTTVKLSPYHAGTGYLPESVLSCINHKLEDSEFAHLRAQAGADHQVLIVLPEANAWIDEKILLPRYKAILDQKVAGIQAEDRKRFEAASAGADEKIADAMIRDFASWQPGGAFQYGGCKAEAGKRLLERFPAKEYRFLPLGAELDPMGNRVCEKIRLWSAANAANAGKTTAQTSAARTDGEAVLAESAIPSTLIERTPDALYRKLVPALVASAKTRFAQCGRKADYKSPRLRRYCLFTEWVEDDQDHARKNAWAWTRDRGVRAWLKDPEVVKYRQSKGYPETAFFEAVQTRVDDESDPFVEAILDAFSDQTTE